jgi:hypothetical protein
MSSPQDPSFDEDDQRSPGEPGGDVVPPANPAYSTPPADGIGNAEDGS